MNKLSDEYRKAFGTEADQLYSQVKTASKLQDVALKAGKSDYLSHLVDKIGSLTDIRDSPIPLKSLIFDGSLYPFRRSLILPIGCPII